MTHSFVQKKRTRSRLVNDYDSQPLASLMELGKGKHEKPALWKRRAKRSKEILSTWFKDKKTHLDFNVGAGVKRNSNPQLLTNGILKDLCKFAVHMHKSKLNFIRGIFRNNTTFAQLGPKLQSWFLVYITAKMRTLTSHPLGTSAEFLNAVDVAETYRVVEISSSSPAAVTPPSATFHKPSMEDYPFCMELGLNLWSLKERPLNEKLNLCLLTNGALLEVSSFITKLCGTVWELMYDLLEHNFHFNLQELQLAQELQMWRRLEQRYATRKGSLAIAEQKNYVDKIVKAMTKSNEEHTPDCNGIQDPYPLCKEMQIHLHVNSERETRAKLDLQVLTRAVVYEIHRYVEDNPQAYHYVPTLYKILEDNFDLSSQLHRRCEFAWAIASQVRTMAGNFSSFSRKGDYPHKVFELPFEFPSSGQVVCKEEPEDGYCQLEPDDDDDDDIEFVCQLNPVDIEVTLD